MIKWTSDVVSFASHLIFLIETDVSKRVFLVKLRQSLGTFGTTSKLLSISTYITCSWRGRVNIEFIICSIVT